MIRIGETIVNPARPDGSVTHPRGRRIAVLLGDGIGPAIIESAVEILRQAASRRGVELEFETLPSGLNALETHGNTLPAQTLEQLPEFGGWMLGPVSHHIYPLGDPTYVSPSGYLRKHFDLYANVRPVRAHRGVRALHPDVDLVVVRENTEGFYADRNVLDGNGELRPDEDMVISVRVVTRRASMRIARRAFEIARSRRRHVTAVHKANVLRRGDGLFLECCEAVAEEFPDVSWDNLHADAFAMHLVREPARFDVVVTTNMFGDILSEAAAGLVGGVGLAPSLNSGEGVAMGQAVHGSAIDIAGTGRANPIAAVLSGQMLVEWLGGIFDDRPLEDVAGDIERAVCAVLESEEPRTPDLGGSATTDEMTQAILDRLVGERP